MENDKTMSQKTSKNPSKKRHKINQKNDRENNCKHHDCWWFGVGVGTPKWQCLSSPFAPFAVFSADMCLACCRGTPLIDFWHFGVLHLTPLGRHGSIFNALGGSICHLGVPRVTPKTDCGVQSADSDASQQQSWPWNQFCCFPGVDHQTNETTNRKIWYEACFFCFRARDLQTHETTNWKNRVGGTPEGT